MVTSSFCVVCNCANMQRKVRNIYFYIKTWFFGNVLVTIRYKIYPEDKKICFLLATCFLQSHFAAKSVSSIKLSASQSRF